MSATPKPDAVRKPDPGKCLARSVAQALAEDPTLEAVTVDQAHHTISVATLGQTDVPKLTERISATVQQAQESDAVQPCTLLAGETTCQTCGQPLSDFERQKITIRQEADTTTIARVTCPTAPKFWRWRDIPWPKVVQRDVEFLEHAEEVDEWKAELVAAILCGVFGLGAWFFRAQPLSVIGYVLAYLAGSWFTAQDVWERLRKRAIDVHFLMLAVALGSASIGAWGEGTTLLFLFSLSGALERFALGRTQREIRSLFRDAPKFATVLDERGQEREVQVEKLRRGHAPAGQARRPVPGGCRNRQRPDRQRRIQPHRRSHARGQGHRRHRPRRHHQPLGRGRSARAAAGGGEFLAEDHPPDQGSPAAESPGAAVHRPVRHATTPTACWGCRSSCSSSGGWALARRRLRRRASGTARFITP